MASWPSKDPDEVLDYMLDWSRRLDDGDGIDTATFSLTTSAGMLIVAQSNTTTTATVWLSGGTLGETGEVLCRVVTDEGRTFDWSMDVPIVAR